jgi:hypothetical protein
MEQPVFAVLQTRCAANADYSHLLVSLWFCLAAVFLFPVPYSLFPAFPPAYNEKLSSLSLADEANPARRHGP